MGRILAIDFGLKRTGIAITDELQLIASALTTVFTKNLLEFLKDLTTKETIDLFVVGAPKQLNNKASNIEVDIQEFLETLKILCPNIPIQRIDERFTSKMALKTMIDVGLKKRKRQDKATIDKISATLILQSYLHYK